MKILRKTIKLIIILFISFLISIIGINAKGCSNQEKAKVKRAINNSDPFYLYIQLPLEVDNNIITYETVNLHIYGNMGGVFQTEKISSQNKDFKYEVYRTIINPNYILDGGYDTFELKIINNYPWDNFTWFAETQTEFSSFVSVDEVVYNCYTLTPYAFNGAAINDEDLYWCDTISTASISYTSYFQGYDNGYNEGYDEGLYLGELNGIEYGYNQGYQQGLLEGEETGYDNGYNVGYDEGYELGHEEGYQEGLRTTSEDAFLYGYELGFREGKTEGSNEGYISGYETGYQEGYQEGLNQENNEAFLTGYEQGFEDGKIEGYQEGFEEGANSGSSDIIKLLEQIFKSMDQILSVEILPNIKIWYLIGIPLVLSILHFILGWFR